MTLRTRATLALSGSLGAAVVFPAVASAHAVAGKSYEFQLPVWLYAVSGGLVVLLSVPMAVAGAERGSWTSDRSWTPGATAALAARIARVVLGVAIVIAVVGGLFGDIRFYANPATVLFWIDLWVGVAVVAALIGNVWDAVSPVNALGRMLEQQLARDGITPRPYPARLGMWPAIVQLLALAWLELCWTGGSNPQYLAAIIVAYLVVQLGAMALFGAEVWLERGELFTALARVLSRFAPAEMWCRTAEPCQALRCRDGERRGCPSCFIDADADQRGVRLRSYGSGVHREPPLAAAGGAFVLAMLATVVFDGFSRTTRYIDLTDRIAPYGSWLGAHSSTLRTLSMVVVVTLFVTLFVAVCALVGQLEGGGTAAAVSRYAPTLIPIAAVYFVAHYLVYAVVYAQLTPQVLADPFASGWLHYRIFTSVPGWLVWWIQAGVIVVGHVVAVFEAQRVARRAPAGRRLHAALMHSPITALMVLYTMAGLWVLAQALEG